MSPVLRIVIFALACLASVAMEASFAPAAPAEDACCSENECCCAVEEPTCCSTSARDESAPAFVPGCSCGGHGEDVLHVSGSQRWMPTAEPTVAEPAVTARPAREVASAPVSVHSRPEPPPPRG